MFPTLGLCFTFAVTVLLPQEVLCPDRNVRNRRREIDINNNNNNNAIDIPVEGGGSAQMISNFPGFDPSKLLHLAKLTVYSNGTYNISEVLEWSPEQSLQNATIYEDRVSLTLAVILRDVRQTDVSTDAQHVYYQFQQKGVQGPKISLHIVGAPKFIELEHRRVVAKGSPVSILVKVTAYPLPVTFSWFKDGRNMLDIANNALHISQSNDGLQSALSYLKVTETDYGLYNVTATNAMGSSSAIIQLAAESAPEPPYSLKVTRKYPNGHVHLEWTAGFNGGQDTTYTVQYREMGGEWVDAHEPPRNNHPNYTDIVQLPEKGDYSIRIRAANRIEPPAFSNITNVTIEDDTTLRGLLPITNWDYSEDLQTLTSPLAEQLSSTVISELDKVFNNIIGYQKSETKVDSFKEVGGTCTSAGDVMVDFHITVAESEVTSAQSVFSNSIKHERLGEFNIDRDRACVDRACMGIVKPPCKDLGFSDVPLWLYRVQNGILFAQIAAATLFQIFCPNHKWAKTVTYLGPVIPVIIIQTVFYTEYRSYMTGPYIAFSIVSHLMLFYGLVGVILFAALKKGPQVPMQGGNQPTGTLVRHRNKIKSVFKQLPIIGLALNYASVIIDLGYDTSTIDHGHTELIWNPSIGPVIFTVLVLGGNWVVTVLLWYRFLRLKEQGYLC